MQRLLKSKLAIPISVFLIALACVLGLYWNVINVAMYASRHPDQTVFAVDKGGMISAVKHSNEANYDMVASENPPIYLGNKPDNCRFTDKDDFIFTLTGIWVAHWECGP